MRSSLHQRLAGELLQVAVHDGLVLRLRHFQPVNHGIYDSVPPALRLRRQATATVIRAGRWRGLAWTTIFTSRSRIVMNFNSRASEYLVKRPCSSADKSGWRIPSIFAATTCVSLR